MALLDSTKEADIFRNELSQNIFFHERSQNSEVNYAEEKEQRDRQAVKKFVNSKEFDTLCDYMR